MNNTVLKLKTEKKHWMNLKRGKTKIKKGYQPIINTKQKTKKIKIKIKINPAKSVKSVKHTYTIKF